MILIGFLVGSEKRVGNVYSKASSFVDYVRRALRKLELDESKVRGGETENERWRHTLFLFSFDLKPMS